MARSKLPKWAIKQAGGINKKAWRLARRGKKRSASRSRKGRDFDPKGDPWHEEKLVVPHPSVTGMAAGFSILDDLNKGDVSGDIIKGNIGGPTGALNKLSVNSQNLIRTEGGRKALFQAIGIAAIGAFARKSLPSTKLGGTKFYFRI